MKIIYWFLLVFYIAARVTFLYLPGDFFSRLFAACFVGAIIGFMVFPIAEIIRRYKNGIDIFATLETDPEKIKSHMLHIMQWGHRDGAIGAVKEFNDIFRNYPQWELHNWEVFRAWYKHKMDILVSMPDVFKLTLKDSGAPYSLEDDPLYDPNAPDWALFDRDHTHDYDYLDDSDDYCDDDYTRRKSRRKRRGYGDAVAFGIGFGLGSALTGDSDSGGDCGCDGGGDCGGDCGCDGGGDCGCDG